jgi:hypothetical protein
VEKLDYWRLCTDFTVVQAALIACGIAPEDMQWRVEQTTESQCPPGYIAIRTALVNALYSGKLKPSKTTFTYDHEGEQTPYYDVGSTTIAVEEIDRFLKGAGVICDFFDRPRLVDQSGTAPGMPVKLNAALRAWAAVSSDPARLRGKSPKQALEQWLLENAEDLGLLGPTGEPNRTGIEEICKVANWKPNGGAPPTPTSAPVASRVAQPAMIRLPLPRETFSADLDDEIPF